MEIKLVRFTCGKYGVTDGHCFYDSRMYPWSWRESIAKYCKMYKWQANRLIRKLNIDYTEVGYESGHN